MTKEAARLQKRWDLLVASEEVGLFLREARKFILKHQELFSVQEVEDKDASVHQAIALSWGLFYEPENKAWYLRYGITGRKGEVLVTKAKHDLLVRRLAALEKDLLQRLN